MTVRGPHVTVGGRGSVLGLGIGYDLDLDLMVESHELGIRRAG